jgi:hypothetical protein
MRYYGPFKFLEKIGPIAYMFAFLTSIGIHYVFHVYLVKKYVCDPNHMIDWTMIQVESKRDF